MRTPTTGGSSSPFSRRMTSRHSGPPSRFRRTSFPSPNRPAEDLWSHLPRGVNLREQRRPLLPGLRSLTGTSVCASTKATALPRIGRPARSGKGRRSSSSSTSAWSQRPEEGRVSAPTASKITASLLVAVPKKLRLFMLAQFFV
jgi:hypothetical protein